MKSFTQAFIRHLFRRGQVGQSIVILAMGFVALLGFVGLVTDVSVLFVRYSTLRRAVDAAAVAAATQMRRVEDSNPNPNIDTGNATSMANMNLAARTYLELYGLNTSEVIVETCGNQLLPYDANGNVALNSPLVIDGETVYTAAEVQERYNAVCRDQRKLVRVTATIESPTIFLSLLGMGSVTLTVESISETAVLDVVLILDASESLLEQTLPIHYNCVATEIGQTPLGACDANGNVTTDGAVRYLPGHVQHFGDNNADLYNWWQEVLQLSQKGMEDYVYGVTTPSGLATWPVVNGYVTINGKSYFVANQAWSPTAGFINNRTDSRLPREECRPRFWPGAHTSLFGSHNSVALNNEFRANFFGRNSGVYNLPSENAYYGGSTSQSGPSVSPNPTNSFYRYFGWVTSHDFYGCCNDPNGDGDFSDLVCQPFRQVRDSAEAFLERVDFARGDRVALVTFNRSAYVIDPDNNGPLSAMMDEQERATQMLNEVVGVMAEPNFYANNEAADNNPRWEGFSKGVDPATGNALPPHPYRYNQDGVQFEWRNSRIGSLTNFPVRNNCPYRIAALDAPYQNWTSGPQGGNNLPILYNMAIQNTLYPNWIETRVAASDVPLWSYDFRASCRDGNIGSGLAQGNTVLNTENPRREGAVWIMILLGDGAAGATDPIRRNWNDANPPIASNPYQRTGGNVGPPTYLAGGQYGSFGACPTGTSSSTAELLKDSYFPFCSDRQPESRHFCPTTDPNLTNPRNNPIYLGLNNNFACEFTYDVEDYARDWADYIGGVTQQQSESFQLPIIFTIGFGLFSVDGTFTLNTTYQEDPNPAVANNDQTFTCNTSDIPCMRKANIADYLGEELLRYIADAGDNNQIDTDYWQYVLADPSQGAIFEPIGSLTPSERIVYYGDTDPCEGPRTFDPGAASPQVPPYSPLPFAESCGNYFWAPNEVGLQAVFGEIASRMFTRLSS